MIDFNEGRLILIDKPLGKTSFQAVKHIKYIGKVKKVGHAGTLDPLATGLLIICTGKWTKKITDLQLQEKNTTERLFWVPLDLRLIKKLKSTKPLIFQI
jgi:tRNA pseudouridine55 synthase